MKLILLEQVYRAFRIIKGEHTFENEDLMYAPMWLVTLSNDESYLIHAIEGDVQNLTVEEEEET